MAPKMKKALLAGLTIALFGLSFYVVRKSFVPHGSYEFENAGTTSADREIPVAPGPATPGPADMPTQPPPTAENQAGVPVVSQPGNQPPANTVGSTTGAAPGSGAPGAPAPNNPLPGTLVGAARSDRRLAGVAPGAGIAAGPHGVPPESGSAGGAGSTDAPSATTPGTPAPGVSGATDKGVPVIVDSPVAAKTPEPSCFTFTYKHKPTAGHDGEEACSHHRNLVQLKNKNVNPGSVCLRVNGKPVHFVAVKGHPEELVLGPVAGPQATITASYCTGKVKCAQTCKIPKDEFLDAIGGGAGDGDADGLAMGQWEVQGEKDKAQNEKLVADMKKELNTIDAPDNAHAKDVVREGGSGDGYTLFQDWLADAGTPSCEYSAADSGTRVADLTARRKKGE